ncbi:MAG: iron uptake porin, partial [Spirulinaceae cyanobacterium]
MMTALNKNYFQLLQTLGLSTALLASTTSLAQAQDLLPELPSASTTATDLAGSTPLNRDWNQFSPAATPQNTFDLFTSGSSLGQTPSASQFADVSPGDWAYQALDDLVRRYDCLKGYPNGTFRGDRALSRYEFAAGLNACMQTIERLLAETTAEFVTAEDLDTLQRLMADFETELAQLDSQVDALDARLQFLEDNQFSTTTKLFGQVVVGLQGRFANSVDAFTATGSGSDGIRDTPDPNNEISMGYNAQLTLLTQFAPGSFLLTGLQAGNLDTSVTDPADYGRINNNFLRLGYESNTNNGLLLSDVSYRQRVTDNLAMIIGPAGVNPVNVFRGPSRVESAGFGPISRFAQRNPIIQLGGTSAGVGFDWQAHPKVSVQGVYSAAFANTATAGIFDDSYTWGLQAFITPTRNTDVALYFLNSQSGSSGGFLNTLIGDEQISSIIGVDLETNAFGITANWDITDDVTLGGWMGWTTSHQLNFAGSAQTHNWMLSLQFPDLFAEGNYGGIFFGVPPRITESNLTANGQVLGNIPSFFETGSTALQGGRDDTAYHLEAFYRWRLTDNITITPGVVAVFNPGHNASNDTVFIGALRTTFS